MASMLSHASYRTRKERLPWQVATAILLCLILAGCSGGGRSTQQGNRVSRLEPAPSAIASPIVPYEPTYVVYARAFNATALAIVMSLPTPSPRPNLHPVRQDSEKREYLWKIALPTARALFPPPPDYDLSADITPPAVLPVRTKVPPPSEGTETGILWVQVPYPPDPTAEYIGAVNRWDGRLNDHALYVYAGHHLERPEEGVLLIQEAVQVGTEYETRVTDYRAPNQPGALRIIGERDGLLTIQAANGLLLYFDLATRSWVSPP